MKANESVVEAFLQDVINGHHGNDVAGYLTPDMVWYGGTVGAVAGQANVAGGPLNDLTVVHGALVLGGTINVTATADGPDLLLTGFTRMGRKFFLRLKRQQAASGESTLLALDWEADADEPFWLGLLELLASLPPPPPPEAPEASGPAVPATSSPPGK